MVLASFFLCMQQRPLYSDRVGVLAYPPLPCSPVLFRISPLGSQKGCRRQAWHTAGSVGAGSQLGPAGRDRGSAGTGYLITGNSQGPLQIACGSQDCTSEATLLSQHFLQILHLSLPVPVSYRDRARPPGCSLVWSHRHSHVAALPKIKCHEWEYKLAPSSRTGKSILLPKGGRRKSPEKGCQVRRARRRGFHRLCFEP